MRSPENRPTPGSTARHEAEHTIAAIYNGTDVTRVTINPGPGYLGLTELSRPDAVAAVAPHAVGSSGTGHDVTIVRSMGHSVESVSSVARSIISNHEEEVIEVATVLEERRTIGSYDIREAINRVHTRSKETPLKPGEWAELETKKAA